MTERSRRVARLAALVAICSASVIAARSALAAESRRWILSQPAELRDLYLDGELTTAAAIGGPWPSYPAFARRGGGAAMVFVRQAMPSTSGRRRASGRIGSGSFTTA